MQTLTYQALAETGYQGYLLPTAPIKVLQFGEGNFLRAFVNYFMDIANEKTGWNGKAAVVQPIAAFPQMADWLTEQEGLYTLYLRGNEKGEKIDQKRVISSVASCVCPYAEGKWAEVLRFASSTDLEFITSNTTEAGIAYTAGDSSFDATPPESFPAKLTRFLYARYEAFSGDMSKGLPILACELIDNNGAELQKCCNAYAAEWGLDAAFIAWLNEANTFCSTLVDRIVPGAIRDVAAVAALEAENAYTDRALDVGEVFGVWVIEGPAWLGEKLPFAKAGCNVLVVPDVTPYKKRKVRILNGAHTGFVLGAYLAGFDIVRDCMENETIRGFMNKMLHEEIIPTLPLDKQDLTDFAAAVQDRFNNPFINHELMSITLNSTAKYKARNLPSLLDYAASEGKLPACLTMGLAAYIAFYGCFICEQTEKGLHCKRPAGDSYLIQDDAWALDFYAAHKEDAPADLVRAVLTNTQMWDEDLTAVTGLEAAICADLALILEQGAEAAFASCL
ncbi:MAG: tagaturonate reductase [Faecalibacterium sp.]